MTKAAVRSPREMQALRDVKASHMTVDQPPDARAMGAESAEYTKPTIDPQWMDAWKWDAEEGCWHLVRIPRGQWAAGGPNALMNLRRPDGGFWFTTVEEEAVPKAEPGKYQCFIGSCTKKLLKRSKLVAHVETFHFDESKAFRDILTRIKRQVANEDPRLQSLLQELDSETEDSTAEQVEVALKQGTACHTCGEPIVGKLADHECEETE